MRSQPAQRLDPRAKRLWRIQGAISSAFLLLPALGVSFILRRVVDLPAYISTLPLALWLLLAVLAVAVTPGVRWRRWRYEIGDTEVDLQRGILYVTRTLVPLARVQHVDTQQGPIERGMGLASVVFYTAAGPNTIPALAVPVAETVRDRIAALTQVRDEL
ncbi:MAG: PH domain-containing protein [Chloroflexota bacterium]|nr:PH domain-containing protein [Chloroflexota bacterium]